MRKALTGGLLLGLLTTAGSVGAQTTDPAQMRVPMSRVAAAIQLAFLGTRMRVHNYGERHGGSYHQANASSVTIPGMATTHFDIPEFRVGPVRYYVNDINLRRVRVEPQGSNVRLRLVFEDRGHELKGRCLVKRPLRGGYRGCALGSDKSVPDIQINDMQLDIHFTPVQHGNSISYGDARAFFFANIQMRGVCRALPDGCNSLLHYRNLIRRHVVQTIMDEVNRPELRERVADIVRSMVLNRLEVGPVVGVAVSEGDLSVSHRPAG